MSTSCPPTQVKRLSAHRLTRTAWVLLALTLSADAFAQRSIPYGNWTALKREAGVLLYLEGVGAGFFYANMELERQGRQGYCQPERLSLNANNYVQIIDKEIAARNGATIPPNFSVEDLLREGLKRTFPCPAR